jgi:hypothetical protein
MKEQKEFTPQESLELIKNMIESTKGNVAGDSFYFLFWGWLVFACCLVQYIMKVNLQMEQHYWVWFLMPVGGIVSAIYGSKEAKKVKVKGFVEANINYLWISIAISFIVLVFINSYNKGWETAFSYYILLYAIGTFVTGSIIRFRPLVIGGLINFVLAAVSIRFSFDNQLLFGAVAILSSYIIPGHLLRLRFKQQKS